MNKQLTEQLAKLLCDENSWSFIKYIDGGNSASVFEICHPQHGSTALKVYDPAFFSGDNALIEEKRVRLQEELRGHGNKHLIEILEVGRTSCGSTWYQLMEFCPWQNLEKQLAHIPDEKIEHLLVQLVDAVLFLAKNGLVHRDIKPANIAVDLKTFSLKLLDLGVLRQIAHNEGNGTDHDEKKRFVATAQYSPPEYLTREELEGEKGFAAINVYQVGAVLHDLIMKRPIFHEEAETLNKYILYKAVTTKLPLIANSAVSPRLVSLCKAALQKDAGSRLAGVQLEQFLDKNEDAEAIRKRLSSRAAQQARSLAPSIVLWEEKVRGWIRDAAVSERTVAGSHTLRSCAVPGGVGWTLSFRSCPGQILISLSPNVEQSVLVLSFSAIAPEPLTIEVLEISDAGPQMDKSEIHEQLRNNILYMLDLQG